MHHTPEFVALEVMCWAISVHEQLNDVTYVTLTLRWLGLYDLLYIAVFRSNTKLHAKLCPNPPTIIATLRVSSTLSSGHTALVVQ